MRFLSFDKGKMRVLLLEAPHPRILDIFKDDGYTSIEYVETALDEDELLRRIGDIHILGIRSRTKISASVLARASKLLAIGCFCIGTDQVNLATAAANGIPVFHAPFSNTRSVAELVLGHIIHLLRRIPEKNAAAHAGIWLKSATHTHEVRGKTLGIVGYGHIGMQLSVLAEALGMHVLFFDAIKKLPLGNAVSCHSLSDLVAASDVISLHVPDTPATVGLIDAHLLSCMKRGAMLINASRGRVVDIPALCEALAREQVGGAAIDVFPDEPASTHDEFVSPLRGMKNVILTPHIGGSTMEAQESIAREVADSLLTFLNNGSTTPAVNFPRVALAHHDGKHRILHIHRNIPGVLAAINHVFSSHALNISSQYLQTNATIGYVVIDLDQSVSKVVLESLKRIDGTIRARILY